MDAEMSPDMRDDVEIKQQIEKFDLRVAKLDLKPGDVLLFKTDFMLSKEQVMTLRKHLDEQVPLGVRTMLVCHVLQVVTISGDNVPIDWKWVQTKEKPIDWKWL